VKKRLKRRLFKYGELVLMVLVITMNCLLFYVYSERMSCDTEILFIVRVCIAANRRLLQLQTYSCVWACKLCHILLRKSSAYVTDWCDLWIL
jgi:hypothetical protein